MATIISSMGFLTVVEASKKRYIAENTNMKELDDLVMKLYNAIAVKEAELKERGSLDTSHMSLLQNRTRDIGFFKDRSSEVVNGPERNIIIENFNNNAEKIFEDIQRIGVLVL